MRRCRRHELGGHTADQRDEKDRDHRYLDAVTIAIDDNAAKDRSCQNGDIGASFDQSGSPEYLVFLQMLGKNGIFDGTEKGGLQTQEKQRGQHDRNIVQPKANPANHGNEYLQRFDETCNPRLVVIVGQLSGERGKEEKRQDEQPGGEGIEREILGFTLVNAIGHQDDHREFEQIVVKCPEQLRQEQGQKPSRSQQMRRILHKVKISVRGGKEAFRHP